MSTLLSDIAPNHCISLLICIDEINMMHWTAYIIGVNIEERVATK